MGTKLPSSLKVGDRVSRALEMGNPSAGRRFGIVHLIYMSTQGVGYTPQRLYAVKWDDNKQIEKGYIEETLQIER